MALEGRGLHIAQLRYFTTIAQPENVSQAAQLLHLSQSSLSKNLAKLAAEVRTPLFDHSGKRLTLNPAFIRKYFPQRRHPPDGVRRPDPGAHAAPPAPPGRPWSGEPAPGWLRYVNRQKGSGTRILIDYLCKRNGMDTAGIYGYDREEFTHTSLAAQIAAGTADAGMGFFSAAQLYSPDLLPACMSGMTCSSPTTRLRHPHGAAAAGLLHRQVFRLPAPRHGAGGPGRRLCRDFPGKRGHCLHGVRHQPGTPKIRLCQKLDKPFSRCGSLMAVFSPGGGAPEWLRLCGNCNFVHDMVDRVVREAALLDAELGEESAREGYISA